MSSVDALLRLTDEQIGVSVASFVLGALLVLVGIWAAGGRGGRGR